MNLTAPRAWLSPRQFCLVFGTGLLALGVVGFAATGLADPFLDHDVAVLGFGINPATNLLHLATGSALVVAGTLPGEIARHATMFTTSAYLLLGLLGLLLAASDSNVLGVNAVTSALHLVTGLAAGMAARPSRGGTKPV